MVNREQTFVSIVENENDKLIDFERWGYKKLSTVEIKLKDLYLNSGLDFILKNLLQQGATKISFYSTEPNGEHKELLKTISIEDFKNQV